MSKIKKVISKSTRGFFSDHPYIVKLDDFEGPLDLLLFTLKEKKMAIQDLDVALITEQYLRYINNFKKINLEVASEYLIMASYLIELKSKSLLPKSILDIDQDQLENDNRNDLIARLLNYEKYKKAAHNLGLSHDDRKDFLTKDQSDLLQIIDINIDNSQLDIKKLDPNLLPWAISKMLIRLQDQRPLETVIVRPVVSIESLTKKIHAKLSLYDYDTLVDLNEFIDTASKQHYAATFLILLNLVHKKHLSVYQSDLFADIFFQKNKKELV